MEFPMYPKEDDELDRLEADAQALADVRTLDATFDGISFQWGSAETGCTLWFPDGTNRTFTGSTPEGAK